MTPLCPFHFSNPCSANHNFFSAWYERMKGNLCQYIQASKNKALRLSVGSSLMHAFYFTLYMNAFCLYVEIEDNIGVTRLRNFVLSFRELLCFETFYWRSRRHQNPLLCTEFIWKEPHSHQQSHFMFLFPCLPRFAFFYVERIWRRIVNNSVIQWHIHNTNVFFFPAWLGARCVL